MFPPVQCRRKMGRRPSNDGAMTRNMIFCVERCEHVIRTNQKSEVHRELAARICGVARAHAALLPVATLGQWPRSNVCSPGLDCAFQSVCASHGRGASAHLDCCHHRGFHSHLPELRLDFGETMPPANRPTSATAGKRSAASRSPQTRGFEGRVAHLHSGNGRRPRAMVL